MLRIVHIEMTGAITKRNANRQHVEFFTGAIVNELTISYQETRGRVMKLILSHQKAKSSLGAGSSERSFPML